jgi:hypothetical protein
VEIDVVETLLDDVVLSKQCHQPGVLQVSVRVCELKVDAAEEVNDVELVVVIVPSYLQFKQSVHSTSSGSHLGTSSYT